ncbi:MAG TPA: putative Ig domain-containing protein [Armatimonadota bacterium]
MLQYRKCIVSTVALAAALSLTAARPRAAQLVPTDLNPPGAFMSEAYDVNSSGQIAGTCIYLEFDADGNIIGGHQPAVVWETDGSITVLDPDEEFGYVWPTAINDSGQVIGTWQRESPDAGGFIWDRVNGMRDIGALTHNGVPDTDVSPSAINADGWVIGGSSASDGNGHSWIYRDGLLEEVTDAVGRRFAAIGINDQGQVGGWVIGVSDSDYPAAIWEKPTGATAPIVTTLTSNEIAWPVAINNRSEVVIQNFYTEDVRVWQPDGTRNADGTLNGALRSLNIGGDVTYDDNGNPMYPHYWNKDAGKAAWITTAGIDSNGRVFGSVELEEAAPYRLWVWDNGAVTDVVAPGDPRSSVTQLQMNGSGQMIGGCLNPDTMASSAFLWQVGDAALQNLPGLTTGDVDAYAINDAGLVVGDASAEAPAPYYRSVHACVWSSSAPPTNNPPVLTAPAKVAGVAGAPVSFTAAATDPDEGDSLTFGLVNAPAGAAINPTTGEFGWTPTLGGTFTFDVKVTDAGGLSDTKTVTLDVSALEFSTASLVRNGKTFTVTTRVTNRTSMTCTNVSVNAASLDGSNTNSALPLLLGSIKPGVSKQIKLQFKGVPSGDQPLIVSGVCSLGAFSTTQTLTAP